MPLLVVAGTHLQAEYWMREYRMERPDWLYVGLSRDVLGRRGNRIVFVGTWWESPVLEMMTRDQLVALYGFEDVPLRALERLQK